MVFKLGKCYKHNSGSYLHVCGIIDTILYGVGFAAENENGILISISMNSKEATANYKEVTNEEFIQNNFTDK